MCIRQTLGASPSGSSADSDLARLDLAAIWPPLCLSRARETIDVPVTGLQQCRRALQEAAVIANFHIRNRGLRNKVHRQLEGSLSSFLPPFPLASMHIIKPRWFPSTRCVLHCSCTAPVKSRACRRTNMTDSDAPLEGRHSSSLAAGDMTVHRSYAEQLFVAIFAAAAAGLRFASAFGRVPAHYHTCVNSQSTWRILASSVERSEVNFVCRERIWQFIDLRLAVDVLSRHRN